MFPEHLLCDKHSAGQTHTVTTAQSLTSEFAQSSGGRKAFRPMPASQGWKVGRRAVLTAGLKIPNFIGVTQI